jgi:hypothetical protein
MPIQEPSAQVVTEDENDGGTGHNGDAGEGRGDNHF